MCKHGFPLTNLPLGNPRKGIRFHTELTGGVSGLPVEREWAGRRQRDGDLDERGPTHGCLWAGWAQSPGAGAVGDIVPWDARFHTPRASRDSRVL